MNLATRLAGAGAAVLVPLIQPVMLGGAITMLVTAATQQPAAAQSAEAVAKVAQAITVRIEGATQGSGVLVKREGNRYTVLTAWHVLSGNSSGESIDVLTSDGKSHRIEPDLIRRIPTVDLALLTFTSTKNYVIANRQASGKTARKRMVQIAGYPNESRAFKITIGMLMAEGKQWIADGYQLIYTNPTIVGMSGGPVLDKEGHLIGIHGRGEEQQISEGLGASIIKTMFNYGIPISYYIRFSGGQIPSTSPVLTTLDDLIFNWVRLSANAHDKGDYEQLRTIALQALSLEDSLETECMLASSIDGMSRTTSDGLDEVQHKTRRRILRRKAISAEDFNCRARVLTHLGKNIEAIAEYSRGIASHPQEWTLYLGRGGEWASNAYKASGENERESAHTAYQKALADYSQAISLQSVINQFPIVYIARSNLLSFFNDHGGAIRDQETVLRVLAHDPWAHMQMARFKANAGDLSGACLALQTAKQLQSNLTGNARRYGTQEMIKLFLSQNNCGNLKTP